MSAALALLILASLLAPSGAAQGVAAARAAAQGVDEQRVANERAVVERHVVAMGTSLLLEVTAADRATALAASEAAVRAVEQAEQRLSSWRDDAEVARLASVRPGDAVPASAALCADLRRALDWRAATGGAFDPDVGDLVALYDLRGAGRWPSEGEVRAALARRGPARLAVLERALRKLGDVQLDAGAFGKGAGLDAAAAAALARGARAAAFDFGGQLHLVGDVAARDVEVPDPRDRGRCVARVRVARGAVATTSNSERARVVDGRALGHVLDPRTGRPAAEFGAVTVFASSALDADCLSTACYVLGPERAIALAERTCGVEVLVLQVTDEGGLLARASSGLRGRVRAQCTDLHIQ